MVNISYFNDDKLFSHDLIKQALWKVSFSRRDSKKSDGYRGILHLALEMSVIVMLDDYEGQFQGSGSII